MWEKFLKQLTILPEDFVRKHKTVMLDMIKAGDEPSEVRNLCSVNSTLLFCPRILTIFIIIYVFVSSMANARLDFSASGTPQ